jgi:polygalacturonase
VEHVRIFGGGTLDARGAGLAGAVAEREAPRLLARCVTVERSRCVTLQDVICKESSQAAVRFSHCEDVAARRVVVINDLGSEIPVDGIWVGGSQRVLVEDCLVHTTEDAFVVAAPEGAVTEQVVMRRLVALCGGRALRCGPQGAGNMDRVRFEEVDVVRARDAMDIMHGEGSGEWTDITFREIRVEKWVRQGIALQLFGGGSLKGVRFENLSFATPIRGVMNGFSAAHRVSDITMAGLAVEGRPALNAAAAGIEVGPFVEDLRFDEW